MIRTAIVVGPRTRAGQAVVERSIARGDDIFVAARHDADAAALAGGETTVLRVDQGVDLLAQDAGPVRILVCALGPVHPEEARAAEDTAAFLRDLGFIERLLVAISGRPASVVLISTVIALAPGDDRRYYGGWKCLVEQQLAESIDRLAPRASFSVVYPGRLVDGPARFVPGLHASYRRLAATVDGLADGCCRSRVVGLDARLWMAARGLKLLISSLLPQWTSPAGRSIELPVVPHERSLRP
ncbi:MAG: hypothetical protein ABWX74_05515 [Aeromicrobium sp.]